MRGLVDGANPKVLKECRLQIGLSLSDVAKKIPKIQDIESGKRRPTFNQIHELSKLYAVPRWVFISSELPEEFTISKSIPKFRALSQNQLAISDLPLLKKIIIEIERKRELLLELSEDIGVDLPIFDPPEIGQDETPLSASAKIRKWLGVGQKSFSFKDWKKILENHGVFVFLTSKYKGWSKVSVKSFRGLCVNHKPLPIIIINNSDSRKAQAFTLFHELAHLLRGENSFDIWDTSSAFEEDWCDSFAGNLLIPGDALKKVLLKPESLEDLEGFAKMFHVSLYAMVVRVWKLNLISFDQYQDFVIKVENKISEALEKMKNSEFNIPRNRVREVVNDYGAIYSKVVFDAFSQNDLSLTKTAELFDLKNPAKVYKVSEYF